MNQRIFLKVKAYIERYQMLVPGDTVLIGVSGGADSVCLLLMLNELAETIPLKLLVVHVNHGIRKQGIEDAAFVEQLCQERKIPFYLVEEDVKAYAKKEKLSEEEAGRKIRYDAFHRILSQQDSGKIAVAHNAGDRVETMLFHLFRGTGLSGASGIKPVVNNIIRPILCLSREEIEEYLKEKQVSFCIDHTNFEDTYTRNRIRNHLLPFAEKEICHGAAAHMWEAADIFLETEEYINKQAIKVYEESLVEEEQLSEHRTKIVLNVDVLLKQDSFLQKQVIIRCLEKLIKGRKDITSVHIEDIKNLLVKHGSKQISLPYGLIAAKEYERLILYVENEEENVLENELKRKMIPISIPEMIYVPGIGNVEFSILTYEKTIIIPEKSYTKWFDYDRITRSLVFRTRETGDYLTINNELSQKSLKKYMIGEKIPKNQRGNLYVLADGNHILWIPGYRISQYYKVTENTKRILKVQIRGGH